MLRRLSCTTVVCAAALWSFASIAPAAQRFADPAGTGDCTTAQTPCSYEAAIAGAGNGDEVILAPGDYGSAVSPRTTTVYAYQQLDVHGAAGQPRPRIFSNATFPLGLANTA